MWRRVKERKEKEGDVSEWMKRKKKKTLTNGK